MNEENVNIDKDKEEENPVFTIPADVRIEARQPTPQTQRSSFGDFLGGIVRSVIVLAVILGIVYVVLKYVYPEFKKLATK